eukprot:g678.t1
MPMVDHGLVIATGEEGWSDMTSLLERAAGEMALGEMVHGQSFSLFDAMSALELMDPKMDSGMESARVPTVDDRLRTGALAFDPWPRAHLDARMVVHVMDKTLALEGLWYGGQSLPQTLLACLVLHPPAMRALLARADQAMARGKGGADVIEQTTEEDALALVLCAWCAALLHTCGMVRRIVLRADVYEEEDFSHPTCGLALLFAGGEKRLGALLAAAQGALAARQAAAAAAQESQGSPGLGLDARMCKALGTRLAYRSAVLSAHQHLAPHLLPQAQMQTQAQQGEEQKAETRAEKSAEAGAGAGAGAETAVVVAADTDAEAQVEVEVDAAAEADAEDARARAALVRDVNAARRELRTAAAQLQALPALELRLRATEGGDEATGTATGHDEAKAAEGGDKAEGAAGGEGEAGAEDAKGADDQEGASYCFDAAVARAQPAVAPSRPLPLPSAATTLASAQRLVSEIEYALGSVSGHTAVCDTLEQISTFVHAFGGRRVCPSVVPRSYLLLLLYGDRHGVFGRHEFRTLIERSLARGGVHQHQVAREQAVVGHLVKPVYEWLRAATMNPSRRRRRIEEVLSEWSLMLDHAAESDRRFAEHRRDRLGGRAGGDAAAAGPALDAAGGRGTERERDRDPHAPAEDHGNRYTPHMSGWVLDFICDLMCQYLTLGVSLGLFTPDETDAVFWYLDYLLGARQQVTRIACAVAVQANALRAELEALRLRHGAGGAGKGKGGQAAAVVATAAGAMGAAGAAGAAGGGGGKKKGKKKKERRVAPAEARPAELPKTELDLALGVLDLKRNLVRGVFRFLAALRLLGCHRTPAYNYGGEALRFALRFRAFEAVHTPALLSLEEFKRSNHLMECEPGVLLHFARECFRSTKLGAEKLLNFPVVVPDTMEEELQALGKVAAANTVSLAAAQRLGGASGSLAYATTKLDFSLHQHFPVLKVCSRPQQS